MPQIPADAEIYQPHPVLKANSFPSVGLTYLLSITSGDGNLNFRLKPLSCVQKGKQTTRRGTFRTLLNPLWIIVGSVDLTY